MNEGANREALQMRELVFDLADRAANSEVIPVTVSSDAVVEVLDGPEILMHTADAIDLSRAPLPMIATHKGGQINVGIVEDLRLSDGRLRGVARFGSREEAQGYKADVLSGIIRSVSVGYRRVKGMVRGDGVLVTTRWIPRHVAMVGEPADINAGFFREAAPPFEIDFEAQQQPHAPDTPANPATTSERTAMSNDAGNSQAGGAAPDITLGQDNGAMERLRIKTLQALGRNHKIDDATVDAWIDGGTSSDEAAHKCLEVLAERAKRGIKDNPANLGLTQKEVQRYSITRAIKACVEKSWAGTAPYEAEVSKAVAQRIGKAGNQGEHTFFVPLDVQWDALNQQRDIVVGTASAGGYLVGTNVQSFIELLRNRSVVMRLGATIMPGLQGSVSIPKQITAATAHWFASEAGTATESNITFGQLALSPKTVGGYVEISRQLLLQSTPNAEGVVNADLARVIGLAVDSAALAGPGTAGQPTGIVSTTGVGTANPTAGTDVDYADMIRFQTTVAASNAFLPGFAYVTTPTVAGILMGKPRFTNSDTPIWGGNILDGTLVGAQAISTLQVGSGSMLAGDFSQVVIGEWGVLEVEANPYAQFQAGIVGVRALYSVDVGVRYGAAFALGTALTG